MDGIELLQLRRRADLAQYELAQRLGVPQTVVCDLERGRRPVTPEWERRILRVINEKAKIEA